MKIQNLKCACLGLSVAVLAGCYFPSTDFVKVEPVRFVPPPAVPIPNSRFGWVEVNPAEAQRYKVRVGDLTYKKIIEPQRVNGAITYEAAVSSLADFAVRQVIEAGYCRSAYVPEGEQRLIGSQRPPEMWMYVECNE